MWKILENLRKSKIIHESFINPLNLNHCLKKIQISQNDLPKLEQYFKLVQILGYSMRQPSYSRAKGEQF